MLEPVRRSRRINAKRAIRQKLSLGERAPELLGCGGIADAVVATGAVARAFAERQSDLRGHRFVYDRVLRLHVHLVGARENH